MKYIFVLLILVSCTAKQPTAKTTPSISVFDGSISRVLGCMFAPQECEKVEEEESIKQQKEITQELEQLDKEAK